MRRADLAQGGGAIHRLVSFLIACGGLLHAETVLMTVGETGCVACQQAVKSQWEKIPGVVSVSIHAAGAGDPRRFYRVRVET